MKIFNHSKEKLRELSLSDLISLKAYLNDDCIVPWEKLLSKAKNASEIADFKKRIEYCNNFKELIETAISDRLYQIVPEFE